MIEEVSDSSTTNVVKNSEVRVSNNTNIDESIHRISMNNTTNDGVIVTKRTTLSHINRSSLVSNSNHGINTNNSFRQSFAVLVADDEKDNEFHNFYITIPWSPQIYFSVRGAENFHIYLWIAKDLSWAQNYIDCGMVFGTAALAWLLVLGYHAIRVWNVEEMYMWVALSLWLFGNYWWMIGELLNGDDDVHAPETGHIFEAALAWLIVYYVVLKPFGVIKPSKDMIKKYQNANLVSRFSFFETWRQYEHFHTLCWLGKDWSWNTLDPYTWCICLVPTVLIALDFIYTTYKTKRMTIDCVHYVSQLSWVFGNMIWAIGELFDSDYDDPYYIFHISTNAKKTCRWYSSWALFMSYVPIILLYIIWLPLTCAGSIRAADLPHNNQLTTQAGIRFSQLGNAKSANENNQQSENDTGMKRDVENQGRTSWHENENTTKNSLHLSFKDSNSNYNNSFASKTNKKSENFGDNL